MIDFLWEHGASITCRSLLRNIYSSTNKLTSWSIRFCGGSQVVGGLIGSLMWVPQCRYPKARSYEKGASNKLVAAEDIKRFNRLFSHQILAMSALLKARYDSNYHFKCGAVTMMSVITIRAISARLGRQFASHSLQKGQLQFLGSPSLPQQTGEILPVYHNTFVLFSRTSEDLVFTTYG